jgi:serine O-acetyltransferase
MQLSMPLPELSAYLEALLTTQFPDGKKHDSASAVESALQRLEYCFSRIALRGYRDERGDARFDHLQGDQFAMFLYWISRAAWTDLEDDTLAKKAYLLNRARNGLVVMYDTVLPDIFVLLHTVGTVIGKGTYGNYAGFAQNVTLTDDMTGALKVGEGVIFFPGAFVGGKVTIGSGSIVTANSTVTYQDVPENTIVSGMSPHLDMWPRKRDLLASFFVPPYPGSGGGSS